MEAYFLSRNKLKIDFLSHNSDFFTQLPVFLSQFLLLFLTIASFWITRKKSLDCVKKMIKYKYF